MRYAPAGYKFAIPLNDILIAKGQETQMVGLDTFFQVSSVDPMRKVMNNIEQSML